MPSAESVARYFLHLAAAEPEPTPITQMQLHKLLYYAQGWWLATRTEPMFPGRFQAWVHGPVEVGVYPVFADYDAQPLPRHEARDEETLSRECRGVLESVWLGYGKFSAWQLREMTHSEAPWKDARKSVPNGAASRAPISESDIKRHFEGLHEAACRKHGFSARDLAESLAQIGRREVTELALPRRKP